jgi:hypothetical protein
MYHQQMKISISCLKKIHTFCEHYKKLFREEERVYGALGGTGSLAELNKTFQQTRLTVLWQQIGRQ